MHPVRNEERFRLRFLSLEGRSDIFLLGIVTAPYFLQMLRLV